MILAVSPAEAQFTQEFNPWPVIVDGDTLAVPFWGGLNNPKPSLVDINGDGLVDLMIGEARGKIGYIRNTGTPTEAIWTGVTGRFAGLDVGSWHRFCDIDADGDLDLFCDARNGQTAFYRNETVGANIVFTLVDETFGGFLTGFNNTGDFADLDGDNDLDFFFGDISGRLVQWRNDGDSANPAFVFGSDFYDSVFAFPGSKTPANPNHGFSTLIFADIDGDTDLDMFYGDINNANIYHYANLGSPSVSDLTKLTESFLPATTFGFNHSAFADLDNDSDLDMVVGAANGDNIDNLLLLRNFGSPVFANFVIEELNMLPNIDVGSESSPAFGDLDNDGDLDMLLGGSDGRLRYFENIGTPTAPVFEQVSDFYKGIDVGVSSAPWLVDWDDDFDLDLLLGAGAGHIEYWENVGDASNFDPVLADAQLAGINIDFQAIPRTVDWNEDGLLDLVVGEWDFNGFANVLLYQNLGPASAPVLTMVTSTLLPRGSRPLTIPALVDWDCDGRTDLILGSSGFGLKFYRNAAAPKQFPDSLTLILQSDSLPGSDDGYGLVLSLADIDQDGDMDLFIGEEDGGVNFHRRDGVACVCPRHGDANGDGDMNVFDVVEAVLVAFRSGLPYADSDCCPHVSRVDNNCDCVVNVLDVVTIVATAFRSGPPPCNPCDSGNQCF